MSTGDVPRSRRAQGLIEISTRKNVTPRASQLTGKVWLKRETPYSHNWCLIVACRHGLRISHADSSDILNTFPSHDYLIRQIPNYFQHPPEPASRRRAAQPVSGKENISRWQLVRRTFTSSTVVAGTYLVALSDYYTCTFSAVCRRT